MSFGVLNLFTRRMETTPLAAGLCMEAVKLKVIMGRDPRPLFFSMQDEIRNRMTVFFVPGAKLAIWSFGRGVLRQKRGIFTAHFRYAFTLIAQVFTHVTLGVVVVFLYIIVWRYAVLLGGSNRREKGGEVQAQARRCDNADGV